MKGQHPDRDSLSAYLEEALSIDATQWIEHHLGGCKECRAKLEEERAFLDRLGELCHKIEAPPDFTESVMARIAQQPAHRPAPDLSWRRMGLWVGSGVAAAAVGLALLGWGVSMLGTIEAPEGSGGIVAGLVSAATGAYRFAQESVAAGVEIARVGSQVLGGAVTYIRDQPLAVQLILLLATVAFNYWLSRLVLNYQRRQ